MPRIGHKHQQRLTVKQMDAVKAAIDEAPDEQKQSAGLLKLWPMICSIWNAAGTKEIDPADYAIPEAQALELMRHTQARLEAGGIGGMLGLWLQNGPSTYDPADPANGPRCANPTPRYPTGGGMLGLWLHMNGRPCRGSGAPVYHMNGQPARPA